VQEEQRMKDKERKDPNREYMGIWDMGEDEKSSVFRYRVGGLG
jgi:hypothetical protein